MISGDVKAPEHDPLAFVYSGAPQRSPEWLEIKRGRIGASSLWRWLSVSVAKGKEGTPLKERLDYERELMFERTFGVSFEVYVNSAMQEGIDFEQYAAQEYCNLKSVTLEEVGCWYNDFIAVSPDRKIVGLNAGIEIKIVKDNTFTDIVSKDPAVTHKVALLDENGEPVLDKKGKAVMVGTGVPEKHYKQIQGQLWATGWDYIDYLALNFNTKKFVIIRVLPEQEDIDYMKLSVQENLVVAQFELADRVFNITQAIPENIELGAPIDRSDSNVGSGDWK
jgi:hypothetical protein